MIGEIMDKINENVGVKCPFCGELIDYLEVVELSNVLYKCILAGDTLLYAQKYINATGETLDYSCPCCNEIIASSYDGAVKFLSGAKT